MRRSLAFLLLLIAVGAGAGPVITAPGKWGDQGDGTYVNPVMPGDFSDLDAIRVGSEYYAISSTFQYAPGVAVLHSKDLVNWRIAGHVVNDVTRIGPELNWDRMGRQGRGIWAGAIRFHSGKFRVYFGTPDEGFFVSTAAKATGPWTPVKLLGPGPGWDDPCPFWDDDGQAYLVATHFAKEEANGKTYNIHLFKMNSGGDSILPGSDKIIYQARGSEANKLYKIRGTYYHYFSEVRPEGRVAMMNRASSLDGPWDSRQLIHVDKKVDKEPNQGGFLQIPSGDWYFVTHQGTGDWEGRAGALLPVTWIEGWPVIGRPGEDGIGNMVWVGKKPIPGAPVTSLAASDNFHESQLKPEWEWRYQPRASHWSLRERPGFLRLHAFRPLSNGFNGVGNVLTQRAMRTGYAEVTVKVDLSGMQEGQHAGLAHFAKTYSTLGVMQTGPVRTLVLSRDGVETTGAAVGQTILWLRSTWSFNGMSQFWYSLDGVAFAPFGELYPLTWGSYRGDRVGLFTWNSVAENGYADFDDFGYKLATEAPAQLAASATGSAAQTGDTKAMPPRTMPQSRTP